MGRRELVCRIDGNIDGCDEELGETVGLIVGGRREGILVGVSLDR